MAKTTDSLHPLYRQISVPTIEDGLRRVPGLLTLIGANLTYLNDLLHMMDARDMRGYPAEGRTKKDHLQAAIDGIGAMKKAIHAFAKRGPVTTPARTQEFVAFVKNLSKLEDSAFADINRFIPAVANLAGMKEEIDACSRVHGSLESLNSIGRDAARPEKPGIDRVFNLNGAISCATPNRQPETPKAGSAVANTFRSKPGQLLQ